MIDVSIALVTRMLCRKLVIPEIIGIVRLIGHHRSLDFADRVGEEAANSESNDYVGGRCFLLVNDQTF